MSNSRQINAKLFSIQTERHSLAGLCKYPEIHSDISTFIKLEDFFNDTHKTIYKLICGFIEKKEILNKITLSGKIKQIGITHFEDDLDIDTYIENIFSTPIKDLDTAISNFKILIDYRIRRNIYFLSQELNELSLENTENTSSLITAADSLYSDKIKSIIELNHEKGAEDIFRTLKGTIEDIADNPPDESLFPLGPFPSINGMLGSLHRPKNITLYAARTGLGKTALMFYINTFIAEKYSLPIYWMDCGEMSPEELQLRAAVCLTNGKVPLHAVENGLWKKNTEYYNEMKKVWPRVEKIKFFYQDVSSKSPNEIISTARRFSFNQVGRDNPFLWCLDYLKPFDDTQGESEWRQFGTFIKQIKSFIKNEVPINLQTGIQNNRKGITTGRHSSDVDSGDDAISQDRVTQQVTHALILRRKTIDEIETEGSDFGNMKIYWGAKTRHLGKEYSRALNYVKNPITDKYGPNFVNIQNNNFFYEDKGDYNDLASYLQDKIDIQDNSNDNNDTKKQYI